MEKMLFGPQGIFIVVVSIGHWGKLAARPSGGAISIFLYTPMSNVTAATIYSILTLKNTHNLSLAMIHTNRNTSITRLTT